MANEKQRRPRAPLATTVVRTEQLTDSMVRLVLGGGDLAQFVPNDTTDMYVKLMVLHPEVEYPRPIDVEAIRASFPPDAWPRLRTYTVRAWNAETLEMTIDFVVHGDEGVAGPWARRAKVGDEALLLGPGGGFAPDAAADWHLLVGDESALPAIAAAAGRLPEGKPAHVLIEVHGPEDEIPIALPSSATLTWLHRAGKDRGDLLVDEVTTLAFPEGTPLVFVHGEAGFVKTLRRHLLLDRGVPREQAASISGYWRLGTDDEGWRGMKADWNRQAEQEERAAGVS